MVKAGKNDYLQAVLQPMMDMEKFVQFILLKKYKNGNKAPLCDKLDKLMKMFFQRELENTGKNQNEHNISKFRKYATKNGFKKGFRQDPQRFLEFMLDEIKKEAKANDTDRKDEFMRMFYIEMSHKHIC